MDASVYHLLVGGKWRTTGTRGARRIRQSGDRASVARFARIMLRQSKASAGAYSATLTTSGTDVGGTVGVTLSVTDGHGRPAAGLPVTLAMSGAAPVSAVTGDDGRAVARFAAQTRGWQDVSATVSQVPEHRLHAWAAEKDGQASAAEGGVRRTLVVCARAAVRGPQTLPRWSRHPPTVTVGGPPVSWRTVSGDRASARRHGDPARPLRDGCCGPLLRARPRPPEPGRRGRRRPTPGRRCRPQPGATTPGASRSTARTRTCRSRRAGATVKVRGRATVTLAAPATAWPWTTSSRHGSPLAGLPFAASGRRHDHALRPLCQCCGRLHGEPSRRAPNAGRATGRSRPRASRWTSRAGTPGGRSRSPRRPPAGLQPRACAASGRSPRSAK